MSINKVTLLGNAGGDPESKTFNDGGEIANLTIATSKKGYQTRDGKQIPEKTEWHRVVFSGGLAKIAHQYIRKGDKVYVEGELRTRSYEQNGQKVFVTEIAATTLELLTKRQSEQQTQQQQAYQPQPSYQQPRQGTFDGMNAYPNAGLPY